LGGLDEGESDLAVGECVAFEQEAKENKLKVILINHFIFIEFLQPTSLPYYSSPVPADLFHIAYTYNNR
jgi:hypothetical protein